MMHQRDASFYSVSCVNKSALTSTKDKCSLNQYKRKGCVASKHLNIISIKNSPYIVKIGRVCDQRERALGSEKGVT